MKVVVERGEEMYRARLYDPSKERWLLGGSEASLEAYRAQAQVEQEAQARHALEEQLRALQVELERPKRNQ